MTESIKCTACTDPTPSTSFVMIQSLGLSEHLCEWHKGMRVRQLEQELIPHTVVSTFQQPPTDAETIEFLRAMLQRSAPELRAAVIRADQRSENLRLENERLVRECTNFEEALRTTVDSQAMLSAELERALGANMELGKTVATLEEALAVKTAELAEAAAELEEWEKLTDEATGGTPDTEPPPVGSGG
jgi:chromosome segregation ATPase